MFTRNQALAALLFLYRQVFAREIADLGQVIRACKPQRLPIVLTRAEVRSVLAELPADYHIMATLLYGAGRRLMECLNLRVQDIDFERNEILVRNGKGAKDRITMLPEALDRTYPNAAREWRRQWVFAQKNRWKNPSSGAEGRHHIDESLLQRAVKDAVTRAGIIKHAGCHTFD